MNKEKRETKEFSVWKTAVAERRRTHVNGSENEDLRLRGSFWQFGKLQAVERLLVCRRSERRLRIKSSVCEEQSGSRGVLGLASRQEMKASEKGLSVWK